ncbi:MAG: hypothetical protein GSR75_02710, partial [Desulfurococcales archaeon]|nr:hypothetical protein [Desulfurococcales archaeon]
MNWKKQLMLAAVLIIALSMAAGAYHTEAATQVNSQAIVLTQKTSVGGKLFFVIDVQKLRQTYPQAVAVNVFMDTDPGAAITSTSVPLIYSGGTYNGIKAPYNQYLKLDTSGIGENLLLVSIELPSNNAWWVDVNSSTKINYAEANTVYLKIQIDKNTVAVMDGHFSITNNTLVGKYSIDDTDFSYTGFNAEWYGGPATTKSTGGYIELIHGNGTPLNLTNGKDASWVKYWVYAINENEEYVLFNVTMTPSGIINSGSQMFKLVNVTYYNVSTSLVKFGLVNLTDFPVTPTGTSNVSGGLAFPYGEYGQLLYNVKVSPISDEAYPYKFDNNTNTVTINLSSTSYLQLLLEDTNSVYTIGKITPDGVTGTLTYYTYNSTAYQFQKPGSKNFTVDDVFNETSDKAFEVYVIKWSTVPNIKVYPSLTIASTAPGTIGGPILGSQMNPGDEFKVIGHNLPAGANFTAVSLAYWNGNSKAFEAWETIDVWNNSNVSLTYGNISAIVKVPAHWYGGETFYPMLTVNETGTLYTTWITNSSSLQIYPYAKAYVLLNNDHFRRIVGAKLAPGDYILIKGVGFITTENLTPFLTYDYSSMKNALKTMVTLSDIQGLDTNWDGEVDALFVKDDATGNISIVVKLPTDINITKLAHGFKFGLKGSGDNIGFTISAASSVVYDGSTAKVFIWPYG